MAKAIKLESVPWAIERILKRLQDLEAENAMLRRAIPEERTRHWADARTLDDDVEVRVLYGYEGEGDDLEFVRVAEIEKTRGDYIDSFQLDLRGETIIWGYEDHAPRTWVEAETRIAGILDGTIPDPRTDKQKARR